MKSVAIFCGSSMGFHSSYKEEAFSLGEFFANRGIRIVYGGGNIGLMGQIANGAMKAGGQVTGVIPGFLHQKELGHKYIQELIEVDSMHERKLTIYERSDGFVALPGGFGTLDEIFEIITWSQLGLHSKPIALYNFRNYFDHLIAQLDVMVNEGFLKKPNRKMVLVSNDKEEMYHLMSNYRSADVQKWLGENNI